VSTTLTAPEVASEPSETGLRRWVRRNAWTLGLLAILAILFLITKLIQPRYGPGGVRGLAIGVLPVAFAAVAQTTAVLARGIDLSVGSMMALTSVVGAVLMEGRSEEFAILAPDTALEGAVALAEKLRTAVAESSFEVSGHGEELRITVSVGVSAYHGDRTLFFREADRALYDAKAAGKDCVVSADD